MWFMIGLYSVQENKLVANKVQFVNFWVPKSIFGSFYDLIGLLRHAINLSGL